MKREIRWNDICPYCKAALAHEYQNWGAYINDLPYSVKMWCENKECDLRKRDEIFTKTVHRTKERDRRSP